MIKSNKQILLDWLTKRIQTTNEEKDMAEAANDLNLKIGKGAKACAYRECLEYVQTHLNKENIKNNVTSIH